MSLAIMHLDCRKRTNGNRGRPHERKPVTCLSYTSRRRSWSSKTRHQSASVQRDRFNPRRLRVRPAAADDRIQTRADKCRNVRRRNVFTDRRTSFNYARHAAALRSRAVVRSLNVVYCYCPRRLVPVSPRTG